MKKYFTLVAAMILVVTLHAQTLPSSLITDTRTGKKVPFNETIEKGKVTLISFWGTWCAHGKRQVKTIAGKMADWKKQADFNFIAIATDQPHNEALVRPYVLAQGWQFPCYTDALSNLKGPLHFDALPYIIIIDKKGKVAFTHTGCDDGALILQKLKEFAEKKMK